MKTESKMTLAEAIDAGLATRKDIMAKTGIHESALSKLLLPEKKRRYVSVKLAAKICEAVGFAVDPESLVTAENAEALRAFSGNTSQQ